jgi:lipid-A-disaccharide synthase
VKRDGPPLVLIVAGEASGDLYGGLLMTAMRRLGPVRFVGIGGPSMRTAGLSPLGDAEAMGVTGLLEVASRLRVIWRAYREASRVLSDGAPGRGGAHGGCRPDLVVLIDYPDFNLRLAKHARRAGVPVLYFVSPQVWAWRRGRVPLIAKTVDTMLVILPFEEEFYRKAGVAAEFVGHPLLDLVHPGRPREQALRALRLDPGAPVVALLPGSRRNEIRSHLPAMLGAARILRREFRDLQFILPVAPTVGAGEILRIIRTAGGDTASREASSGPRGTGPAAPAPVLVEQDRYEAVAAADAAAVASGTATLETALLGVPMVVVYRMNPLTYLLARTVSEVPHIAMPNLIVGHRLVTELVQAECRPDRIAAELRRILTDPAAGAAMRRGLLSVRDRLGPPGAIERAGRVAWGMIGAPSEAAPPA